MNEAENTHADVVEGNCPIGQVTLKVTKTQTSKNCPCVMLARLTCFLNIFLFYFNGYFSLAVASAVSEIAKIALRLKNVPLLS